MRRRWSRTIRRVLAAIWTGAPPAFIVLSWLCWQDQLTDEIGTHWTTSGPADGTTPTSEFFTATLVTAAVSASVGITSLALKLPPVAVRLTIGLAASVSAIAAAQWLISTHLTLEVGDPYSARLGSWPLAHMASALYGLIPAVLVPGAASTDGEVTSPRPR